jgi:hypothetical protein
MKVGSGLLAPGSRQARSVGLRAGTLAIAIALALVLFRGWLWVWFAPCNLDGDEAITGLMAKHLAEGRAFPLFFYGQTYLLGVEAWIAAPVFALGGASAHALRGTILALNLLVAWLLVRELVVTCRLAPWAALAASLFVVLPAMRTGAMMGQAVGMNVEPFLVALLLWRLRGRPLWFGAVFAVGFLNREFAVYALVAVIVLAALDGRLFRKAALRSGAVAVVAFAGVWDVVQTLRPWSSPSGPGTATIADAASNNITRVAEFAAFSPTRLPSDLWAMATFFLPDLFGARQELLPPLAAVRSWQAHAGSWPLLALLLAIPFALALGRLARDRTRISTDRVRFPLYLVLIAAQAAVVCAASRGAGMSVLTERYILLTLFGPVGMVALVAGMEPRRLVKGLAIGAAIAWGFLAFLDTGRLIVSCIRQPPRAPRLELARYLEHHGVRYGEANYWTAYPVSFLSEERVKVASTDVERVNEYRWLFLGHRDQAVVIQAAACEGCVRVAGTWVRPGPRR